MPRRSATYPAAVLVVDDDPFVLQCMGAILRDAGFFALSASTPGGAIEIESVYPGTIRLLLSDVEMPEMTGPDLAAALTARRPGMRVLLMSACGALQKPLLRPGWRFIQKPFGPVVLVGAVSDALSVDSRHPDQNLPSLFNHFPAPAPKPA
jgi:DNA-binding NtrC family response regulator